jgi:hypothetical protein
LPPIIKFFGAEEGWLKRDGMKPGSIFLKGLNIFLDHTPGLVTKDVCEYVVRRK